MKTKVDPKGLFSALAAVSMILPVLALVAGVYLVTKPQELRSGAFYQKGSGEPRERIGVRKSPKKVIPKEKIKQTKKSKSEKRKQVATFFGQVQLEGRQEKPPSEQWITKLIITARPIGSKISKYNQLVTTDKQGVFFLGEMTPGDYEFTVKGVHTLRIKERVTVKPGVNGYLFKVLPEGDADNNNVVDKNDFQQVLKAFNKRKGNPAYNENADFNQDGKVDILDFSLLAKNWQKKGEAIFSQ
jgi:hypothetical protein